MNGLIARGAGALALAALALVCAAPSASFAEPALASFSPAWDGAALALGAGASIASELALGGGSGGFDKPDPAGLSGFDRALSFPYSEGLDKVSLGVEAASLLYPALFCLVADEGDRLPAAAAYAEALLYTFAAKNCLKALFPKARPYAYYEEGLSGELLEEADESFPSGHSALAFAAATSFAVLALRAAPADSRTPWLVAGAYLLASGEGALRVASGEHFLSDVAAGAALGAGIGYLAASLRLRPRAGAQGSGEGVAALVSADALMLRIAL